MFMRNASYQFLTKYQVNAYSASYANYSGILQLFYCKTSQY